MAPAPGPGRAVPSGAVRSRARLLRQSRENPARTPAPPAAAGEQTSMLRTCEMRPAFSLTFSAQAAYLPYLGAGNLQQ